MYLRQRNHPIEALPSDCPDHALERAAGSGDPGDTVRPAALAEPDLESYPIRPAVGQRTAKKALGKPVSWWRL